jgi:hypothetical protein
VVALVNDLRLNDLEVYALSAHQHRERVLHMQHFKVRVIALGSI